MLERRDAPNPAAMAVLAGMLQDFSPLNESGEAARSRGSYDSNAAKAALSTH
jgi:hypothetical protein